MMSEKKCRELRGKGVHYCRKEQVDGGVQIETGVEMNRWLADWAWALVTGSMFKIQRLLLSAGVPCNRAALSGSLGPPPWPSVHTHLPALPPKSPASLTPVPGEQGQENSNLPLLAPFRYPEHTSQDQCHLSTPTEGQGPCKMRTSGEGPCQTKAPWSPEAPSRPVGVNTAPSQ